MSLSVSFPSSFIRLSVFVLSFRKFFTSETNNNKSHMDMFARGHVKSRLADKIPKHSKHFKNALHHANPFQMLQRKKITSVPLCR
jgi:hypothetical protein